MGEVGLEGDLGGRPGVGEVRLYQGASPACGWHGGFRRGAAGHAAARREEFPRGTNNGGLLDPAGGLRTVRLRGSRAPDGRHRQGGAGPEEDRQGAGERDGPRPHRGQDHVRRSRPEHRARHHQICRPGRQVGDLGRERVRRGEAEADEREVAMSASVIAQYVMNGAMLGMMYALVAVGFTLFFGVLDIIQFSHGDVVAAGAFAGLAAWTLLTAAGVAAPGVLLLAVVLSAVAVTALLGAAVARFIVLPVKGAPQLNVLLVTLMAGTVLREC